MDFALRDLVRQAQEWADNDIDPVTRAEATVLAQRAQAGDRYSIERLQHAFGSRITFGTAGLRARLGAGPARMNRVVVIQTALALAQYLWEAGATLAGPPVIRRGRPSGEAPVVVVGFDARANSAQFATDTVEVMSGAGVRAIVFADPVPTPLLAFAVRELDADAGVMITASHNPVGDSGYKVYLGGTHGGSQIVAPVDTEIARRISRIAADVAPGDVVRGRGELAVSDVTEAYIARTAAVVPAPLYKPRVAYTALHGVGSDTFRRVLRKAGFDTPIPVPEQNEPNGQFPTAPVPNPEEPSTMDRVIDLANEIGADLALAHDPDADRLAVALSVESPNGGRPVFRRLTGNDVGLLLGWWACDRATRENSFDGVLAASVVSTPALDSLAASFGFTVTRTLPGFKWISRVPRLIFGFEEALGYLVNPQTVRDKDGISAGLAIVSLASDLHAAGITMADKLDALIAAHGGYVSSQVTLRSESEVIEARMKELRRHGPAELGGVSVTGIDDYGRGFDRLPVTNLLAWHLADGSRVMLRPSGTESKLKVYIDATSAPALERLDMAIRGLFAD